MKEHILNYLELNPNLGYNDLVKIFGLSLEELLELLGISKFNIDKFNKLRFYDDNGYEIYTEHSDSYWEKCEYDINNNKIYEEFSTGYWKKYMFNKDGKQIYYENSDGGWEKRKYDVNNNLTYFENSNDFWIKYEWDDGNCVYRKDSYDYINIY